MGTKIKSRRRIRYSNDAWLVSISSTGTRATSAISSFFWSCWWGTHECVVALDGLVEQGRARSTIDGGLCIRHGLVLHQGVALPRRVEHR